MDPNETLRRTQNGRLVMSEHTKTISWLERLRNSVNGNPRFRIHFTDGTVMVTQSDASVAYGLENPEYRDVPVRVKTTRSGLVYDVTPI